MKKIILLLALLASFLAQASIIPIPDANLKNVLLAASTTNNTALDMASNSIVIDTNGNGEIEDTEALMVHYLGAGNASIASLSGLEYFTNLTSISFPHNLITSSVVPVLTALSNLTYVNLGYNNLSTFTLTNHPNIQRITLYYNSLTSCNVSSCNNLLYLDVYNNSLTSFIFDNNSNLLEVDCSYNNLTSLNVGGVPMLNKLQAIHNNITNFIQLDAPSMVILNIAWNQIANFHPVNLPQLEQLIINDNPTLTYLYAVNCPNLKSIGCSNGALSTLTLGALSNLQNLNCSYNLLTSLVLTGCSSLINLDTSHNLLGPSGIVFRLSGDTTPNSSLSVNTIPTLTTLNCSYNQLTSLNLVGLSNLTNLDCRNNPALTSITVDNVAAATANPNWFKDAIASYAAPVAPVANYDMVTVCASGTLSIDLLANDIGNLDPTSIDLDPNTPGQQTTFIDYNGEILSVDSNGIVSGPYIYRNPDFLDIAYTVSDTSGLVSNVEYVHIYYPHIPLVSDLDFSSTPIDGITGGTTPSVYGPNADPALYSILDPSPYFTMVNGSPQITVAPGTPAGTYVIGYGLINGYVNCFPDYSRYANVTILVTGAPPTASADLIDVCPVVIGGSSNGLVSINLTSNDFDAAFNPVNASTIDLDPASPGIQSSYTISGTTFTVDSNGILTNQFPTFGQFMLQYTVNDINGLVSNVANVLIYFEGTTTARDDDFSSTPINGISGGTTSSVLDNDNAGYFGGASNGGLIAIPTPNMPFAISPTGIITIPPGTNPGTYTTYYESRNFGSPCPNNSAMVTILVIGTPPVALPDGQIVCSGDFLNLPLLGNDSGNIDPTSVDLDPSTPVQDTSIVVNSVLFTVDSNGVLNTSNSGFGFNGIDYTVKDIYGQTSNVAHVNLYFIGLITTQHDNFSTTPINGTTGGTTPSVLDNDTVGISTGYPGLTAFDYNFNLPPNFTINADGTITILPGTPSGTYTFNYVAKSPKRTDCSGQTGQVTVVVSSPIIDAVNDATTVDGTSGGLAISNVLVNDTLNGVLVTPSEVTTTFISSTHPGILLSGTTVLVAPGTPSGSYTLIYQICEISNPYNCDQATVTITVPCSISTTPTFSQIPTQCLGNNSATLPNVSLNGIAGTWSPAIDNTQTQTYTFTPNPGQCATSFMMIIVVAPTVNLYIDTDGDGYNSGTITNCSGVIPVGFSLTSSGFDCNDNNAQINSNQVEIIGNGIDDNCDGTIDEVTPNSYLIPTSCGATLASLWSSIFTYPLSSYLTQTIQGYRFEVTNQTTNNVYTYDTSGPNSFNLYNVPYPPAIASAPAYATTYSIRVAVKTGGFWRSYGVACTVTTPPIPTTTIASPTCGTTLSNIWDVIRCNAVSNATKYRFRVRLGATVIGTYDYTPTPVNPSPQFSLANITGIAFGTTYTIDVLLEINGVWRPNTEYGNACSIRTPSCPQPSFVTNPSCGSTINSFWTTIFAQQVSGAQAYRFVITYGTNTVTYNPPVTTTPTRQFQLRQAGINIPSTTYTIRVDVLCNNGSWITGTQTCTITASPTATRNTDTDLDIFEVKAYPNPFAENFKLDINTSGEDQVNIKVYDMLGREIETQYSNLNSIPNLEIGNQYPSGVYNIIVTQGDHLKSLRVVKR